MKSRMRWTLSETETEFNFLSFWYLILDISGGKIYHVVPIECKIKLRVQISLYFAFLICNCRVSFRAQQKYSLVSFYRIKHSGEL